MLVIVFPAEPKDVTGAGTFFAHDWSLLVPSRRDIPTRDFTSYLKSPQGNRVKALFIPARVPFRIACFS